MRRIIIEIIIICLTVGLLSACNSDRPKNEEVLSTITEGAGGTPIATTTATSSAEETPIATITATPSAERTPAVTMTPTPSPEPVNGAVAIDEAHFSSALFRAYLAKEFDLDKDGILSEEELEEASYISLYGDYTDGRLDGFEYLPMLEYLSVDRVEQIEIKNHPSLVEARIYEGFDSIRLEDCKRLESVDVQSCEGGELVIKNCSQLRKIELTDVKIESLNVTEVKEVQMLLRDRVDIDKMVLDRKVEPELYYIDEILYREDEDGNIMKEYFTVEEFLSDTEVEWIREAKEPLSYEAEYQWFTALTPAPIPEEVPITEEYFSHQDFRTVISARYDTDKNGMLSRAEREAVTEISWDASEFENLQADFVNFYDVVLDGLNAFPKLEYLYVGCADMVVLLDHPSIRSIGGDTGGSKFFIRNCQRLETIGFSFFGGRIVAEDCENLRLCSLHQASFGWLRFTGTPQMVLDIERDDDSMRCIQVDADVVIALDEISLDGRKYIREEEEQIVVSVPHRAEWYGVDETSAIEVSEDFLIVALEKTEVLDMEVEVREAAGHDKDEQGRLPWEICVNEKIAGSSADTYLVYSNKRPTAEQIEFRLDNRNCGMNLYQYAPNKVLSFWAFWGCDVVYHGEEGEMVLGQTGNRQWWTFRPDGTKKLYHSLEEWRDDSSYAYAAYYGKE